MYNLNNLIIMKNERIYQKTYASKVAYYKRA